MPKWIEQPPSHIWLQLHMGINERIARLTENLERFGPGNREGVDWTVELQQAEEALQFLEENPS